LERLFFVPAAQSPFKPASQPSPADQRLRLLRLALAGQDWCEIDEQEVKRGGLSYTIDTVKYFHQLLGKDVQLYFIVGADMLMEISSWKNIEELLKICRFIAVPRPGYDIQKIFNQYFLASENFSIATELLENISIENIPMLDISATNIRRRVKEWKSIKYLVPETVEQFIHNQKIYL